MNTAQDTIVAPATPAGESALAIVRLSGPAVPEIAAGALRSRDPLPPRTALVCAYTDLQGEELDRAVVTYYADNKSFTGEHLLEISLHGNPLLVEKVIADCLRRGARLAEPGEFSRRAFLNGRLDLTQAEAVADLIHARSDAALRHSRQQLRGDLGHWISAQSDQLLECIARLEAYIDFPEEDLPPEDREGPLRMLRDLQRQIAETIRLSRYRSLLHEGVKTVILGAPNSGKSSLINRLLGEERALVSPEPGTTRDYIRERIRLGPHCIQIIDTAGLRTAEAALEQRGIAKTVELAMEADFFLVVIDGAAPPPRLPVEIAGLLAPPCTLVLCNKLDLPEFRPHPTFLPECRQVPVSLLKGTGWEEFQQTWSGMLQGGTFTPPDDALIVNARHARALEIILGHLERAAELADSDEGVEWIVAELRQALDAFGEIIGKIDNESMLDILFRNFCIGK